MLPPVESAKLAQDFEQWVASPWRRALLAAGVTLAASAATTVQVSETLEMRGRPYEWDALFLQQLCVWAPWGLLGGPLVYLARWIFRTRRSWAFAAIVQIPLSLVVAQLFQLYEDVLANVVFDTRWLASSRPVGQTWFRFTRELLVYWLVLTSGAAIYSFLRSQQEERRAAEARVREAELAGEVTRVRLETLRSQLHPHFLFNALHSVGGLVRAEDPKRALQVLSSIAALLRATLDQGEAPEVPLEDELALARRYLEIERIRFGERLAFDFEVEPAARGARVPALFLLTLVENSVRHGVSPKVAGGAITVRARVLGKSLEIEVEDDGAGFPSDVLERGRRERDERGAHIGLVNTRRRLELLYGARQTMVMENRDEGGARVRITLPLNEAVDRIAPAEVARG